MTIATGNGSLTQGVYFHGKLEKQNGNDYCNIDPLPKADGIYECTAKLSDGSEHKAKLFYWKAGCGIFTINRGLVVSVDDAESLADAREKYMKREAYI